jgi:predicted dehydrogenase
MVRYGIIGFGLHAVKRMMPGFAMASESRVTALSRRDLSRARDSTAQFGIPQAFVSAEELCHSPEVDAVFVATPNACHLQDVLTAVRCGKPVLCEKPMAMNAEECQRMVEEARKANVILGVAQVFRFEDSTARFRERIACGDIGKPIFVRSEFSFPAGGGHPRSWLYDASVAGGGPIADVGVHCIDTLRFVLQDEIVRVNARGMRDEYSGDVEAAAVLALEFSRGTLGTVLVSYRAEYRTPFEVIGDSGVLRADNFLNVERPITLELRRGWSIAEEQIVTNDKAYARQVDAFSAAVEGKADFPCPGEEGWRNQLVLDAAYRSIRTGITQDVVRVRS